MRSSVRSMSRPLWRSGRRSSSGARRAPGWLRGTILVILILWGIQGTEWLNLRLVGWELDWVPWVIFGFWWVPTSVWLSWRLAAGVVQLFALPGRLLKPPLRRRPKRAAAFQRCPHCGQEVSAQRAICPHCYRDLKSNCRHCGRIIAADKLYCSTCRGQS